MAVALMGMEGAQGVTVMLVEKAVAGAAAVEVNNSGMMIVLSCKFFCP